ncbi:MULTISPECIES: hypothetical protein [Prauserella salsuginis group]|uniref:Tail assembly chaperone n=2 Tax=Prauserella salsuginis group TaxID=2893672 RepID=A0A839Y228_9PSEU|nr:MULTISPECIES: hypothetical protein [Prauserella salsuginis group]MBB3666396.1 hypothetical protein [Prauserella sediminis]MCR3719134.1 hypothetical protein [Prauserella flava]MCR3735853.1 hypothetical protein [Prauserella salsuginis]
MDIEEVRQRMRQAQRAETSVPICLRGDLVAEWEDLNRQLQERQKQPRDSLDDDGGMHLAERMQALSDEMRDATVTLRFRAMPRRDWFAKLAKHPPRDGNQFDKALGLNQDAFFEDVIPRCLVEPELDAAELAELLDVLSGAQYQAITNAVWGINGSEVSVPFSPIASRMTASSDATSRQQPEQASPSAGGTGGNRKKSRSTSTTKKAG